MKVWQETIKEVEQELIALANEVKKLRTENSQLKQDLTALKTSQEDEKLESELAAKRENFVKLAKLESSESKLSDEFKEKIEAYIQKIDKCLDYLGDGI